VNNPDNKGALFYHAANIALQSDWHRLFKFKSRYRSWEAVWQRLQTGFPNLKPETEWRRLTDSGIRLLLKEDTEYPALLREIPCPPWGLYFRGTLPPKENVAIVGTRKATEEGKEMARDFARRLSEAGLGIVSGLALGIDAAAHEGALTARNTSSLNGKTWAVLATGADRIYPALNAKLGVKILETGGGILSEYPPGSPPLPYRFLERNRIVSGLSRGTLVIEAPKNSGALVTAKFALDQNRELFVVPGPARHPNFRGSHSLIRGGAELVTQPEDILVSLGLSAAAEISANPASETFPASAEEKRVLQILKATAEPLNVDKIIELTNLETHTVNQILSFLIIKGAVKESGEGYTLNN
jgi:DNA processing protein